MWKGIVDAVCIAPTATAPVQRVAEARAIPGRGLEGDRYYDKAGTFSLTVLGPDGEITLIEREAVEAVARERGIVMDPANARRNIVTRGVPLNHLVNREFLVGEVRLRGIRLCEPCSHLAGLTEAGVLSALVHRGGLRAQLLSEGIIRPGDIVEEVYVG